MVVKSNSIPSLIEDFLEYMSVERASSQNTLSSYRNDLFQFKEQIEKSDVRHISTLRVLLKVILHI